MKVSKLIKLLKSMPQDLEVEVNDIGGGEIYPIEDVFHYVPNLDLWPDDVQSVTISVNDEQ